MGAGLKGGDREWGLQDRDKVCVVPVLLLGGDSRANLLLRKSDRAQETGEQRIIYSRGGTAPSSTTYSNRQFTPVSQTDK